MRSVDVDVVESCRGFWWLLRMPNLLSSEDGVLCGDCLLVEKMNSEHFL